MPALRASIEGAASSSVRDPWHAIGRWVLAQVGFGWERIQR